MRTSACLGQKQTDDTILTHFPFAVPVRVVTLRA